MPRTKRTPGYRLHRPSMQAVVTLNGKDFYLGRWGTLASRQAYARLVQKWTDNARVLDPDILGSTVNELLTAYLSHAKTYYQKDGRPTSQLRLNKAVAARIRARYGRQPVSSLTPGRIREWLDDLIGSGLCRETINTYLDVLKRIMRWGVERELVPASCWQAVQAVRSLPRGRTAAHDRPPVRPVEESDIVATLEVLAEPFAAMVKLQLASGMRPSEAVSIKAEEIDRSNEVWIYRPGHHKTQHCGKDRVILLGPVAQQVLSPFLLKTAGYAFSPHTYRSYKHAIEFAQRKHGLVRWNPNQIRHLVATQVRARFNLETAQQVLGHADAAMTTRYAEPDLSAAERAAREIG